MNPSSCNTATVQAELRTAAVTAQILRFEMPEPVDRIKEDRNQLWLDLCLTPRPVDARACYPDHWSADRFERIGEVFFVPPGQLMHVRSEGGMQTSVVCKMDPDLMSRWCEREFAWTDYRLEAGLHIEDRSIRGMMLRLTRELTHPGFASETLLELIATQLAIEIGRLCLAAEPRPAKQGLATWRLRLIDERVAELGKPPSLAELAELCNLSVRQLSRGFRASRGCPIGAYVEQSRIENAKRLLIRGKSVKTVAYAMGFSSPSSFSYAFRRETGVPPAQYRHKA